MRFYQGRRNKSKMKLVCGYGTFDMSTPGIMLGTGQLSVKSFDYDQFTKRTLSNKYNQKCIKK